MSDPTRTLNVTSREKTDRQEWLDRIISVGPTSNASIDAWWRQSRQSNRHEGAQLEAGHRNHFDVRVREHADEFVLQPVRDLLDRLSGTFGFSWIDVSRLLGVSVPALRKWRRDENGASGENHRRLASLVAFASVFEEVVGARVASWMSIPFDPDYVVKPRDVYTEEFAGRLIDHALMRGDFRLLLDSVDAEWRTKWVRNFETVAGEDGTPLLVTRRTARDDELD